LAAALPGFACDQPEAPAQAVAMEPAEV